MPHRDHLQTPTIQLAALRPTSEGDDPRECGDQHQRNPGRATSRYTGFPQGGIDRLCHAYAILASEVHPAVER
jgi:hypothetical protein